MGSPMEERLVAAWWPTVGHHKRRILGPRQVRHVGQWAVWIHHAPHAGVSSVRHYPEDWRSSAAVEKMMLGRAGDTCERPAEGCYRRFGVRGRSSLSVAQVIPVPLL